MACGWNEAGIEGSVMTVRTISMIINPSNHNMKIRVA
jgi:hypothetical protein